MDFENHSKDMIRPLFGISLGICAAFLIDQIKQRSTPETYTPLTGVKHVTASALIDRTGRVTDDLFACSTLAKTSDSFGHDYRLAIKTLSQTKGDVLLKWFGDRRLHPSPVVIEECVGSYVGNTSVASEIKTFVNALPPTLRHAVWPAIIDAMLLHRFQLRDILKCAAAADLGVISGDTPHELMHRIFSNRAPALVLEEFVESINERDSPNDSETLFSFFDAYSALNAKESFDALLDLEIDVPWFKDLKMTKLVLGLSLYPEALTPESVGEALDGHHGRTNIIYGIVAQLKHDKERSLAWVSSLENPIEKAKASSALARSLASDGSGDFLRLVDKLSYDDQISSAEIYGQSRITQVDNGLAEMLQIEDPGVRHGVVKGALSKMIETSPLEAARAIAGISKTIDYPEQVWHMFISNLQAPLNIQQESWFSQLDGDTKTELLDAIETSH